ncbi:acyl-coenzyme A synthetase ACSM3, mitochondrial-like [Mytilus edulis]|uniref:acyl-coenzyme A synthetase ACSM3, mitochondrial-like n=1 Tax=Mytilus edulis TaxID=6550 RepID=UPI0039EF4153
MKRAIITTYFRHVSYKQKLPHIRQSARNKLLCMSRICVCPSVRGIAEMPHIPADFKDYQLHRKLMSNERLPDYFNFCSDIIDQWAVSKIRNPNHPAFWWIDDSGKELKWTFSELSQLSKRAANILQNHCKLKVGDKLIVILPKIPEWWIINLAAIRAGIVLSPGTILLRPNDIKHRTKSAGAKLIIADVSSVDNVDQATKHLEDCPQKIFVGDKSDTRSGWAHFGSLMDEAPAKFETIKSKSSDPMTLFFTSGTTGAPKMALHTHGSYGYGHSITARYMLNIDHNGMMWNMSDTGWAKAAWTSLFAPWIRGACIFIHNSDKFDPERTLQILDKYPLTNFCAPPTVYRHLVKQPLHRYSLSKNLLCIGAGEPVNPELLKEWHDGTGLNLYEGYGQTETTFLCGTYPCVEIRPGSMGKAAPGIDLEIVDNDGSVLPRNTEGVIGVRVKPVRPMGLFSHYVDDDNRNKAVFKGDFYLTGDRGKMDEDDYIWFIGRDDDVMLSSGYRIGPFEVESALIEHPAVLESAVVSSPDEVRGEVVKAFVILTEPYSNHDKEKLTEELQNHVKSVTAPYKYPRKMEFVDQLPKTVSGKIRRVELRNREWGRNGTEVSEKD